MRSAFVVSPTVVSIFPCGVPSPRCVGRYSAPVTLCEFFDYQCPHCKLMEPLLAHLVGELPDQVRVYAKAFPVASGPGTGAAVRLTDSSSNPNFEQFSNRTLPFAGDYLWVDSVRGTTFGTWTDWRDTEPGSDARETTVAGTPEPNEGADVLQCRATPTSGDTCPRAGGLDQNIYGDLVP